MNKINKERKTFKRAMRNRKNKSKTYDDLSLRTTKLKKSPLHYENDTIVLKHRKIEI